MKKKNYYLLLGLFVILVIVGRDVSAASDMGKTQKGKILLQVEAKGEAWYVNPANEMRYYMGRPNDAFNLMRQLGVGITTANLNKIKVAQKNMAGADVDGDGLSDMFEDAIGSDKNKVDSDGDGFKDYEEFIGGHNLKGSGKTSYDVNFGNSQKGKIFIQVEQNGEAWYVNPADGLRYFMGRPADAFSLMRGLGLGITNVNLEKIVIKSDNNTPIVKDPVLDAGLSSIIEAHQNMIKEFTDVYGLYEKTVYENLVGKLFVSGSQATAKKLTDEFFIEFVEYTLKKLNDIDLNEEYAFVADDEQTMLPYEKINASTIVVGLGVDFIMPYELKNEGGSWKIDLKMAKDYYNETAVIDAKDEAAEGSEVEMYLMGKIKSALQAYKTENKKYPQYLDQIGIKYPVIKDHVDDYFYASLGDNSQKCHFGVDVLDDESKLNGDSDFNSIDADYLNGFDGEDPVYDIVLE